MGLIVVFPWLGVAWLLFRWPNTLLSSPKLLELSLLPGVAKTWLAVVPARLPPARLPPVRLPPVRLPPERRPLRPAIDVNDAYQKLNKITYLWVHYHPPPQQAVSPDFHNFDRLGPKCLLGSQLDLVRALFGESQSPL